MFPKLRLVLVGNVNWDLNMLSGMDRCLPQGLRCRERFCYEGLTIILSVSGKSNRFREEKNKPAKKP